MKKSDGKTGGVRKFEALSWYSIFLGCIVVWIINSIPGIVDLITNHSVGFAVIICAGYLLFSLYVIMWKKKRDTKTLIELILLGGFLLRAVYVLAAPYTISKHDIGNFSGFDSDDITSGHLGYIEYLYKNRHLLDFDPRGKWSFSNPPGFHIISAVALGISRLFSVEAPLCYESVQIVNLLFSSLTVLTMYRILEVLLIRDKWLFFLTALLSFHPFFMILAVTANNDCMMAFFSALAVRYTIYWWKKPEVKKILVIAIALGMAMFAKLNAAVFSAGIGIVFICVFWENKKDWKVFVRQFAVFLIVCAPLGLFSPIRNMIKFDMPLLYIQRVGGSWARISDASTFSRVVLPTIKQGTYSFLRFDGAVETNIWIQTVRTSLFDELQPGTVSEVFSAIALFTLWISIVLAIIMNIMFFWSMYKKDLLQKEMRIFLTVTYVCMLLSYISYCLDEPFIFTMNYRYIPIAILFPCIGAGLCAQYYQEKNDSGQRMGILVNKKVLPGLLIRFVVLSVIVSIYLISYSGIKL